MTRYNFQKFVSCIVLLIQGIFALHTSAQDYDDYTIQNISEGLPSLEVYSVLQDNYGFIWCASDRGISRYDGHDFYTYGINEGLNDPTVFKLVNAEGYIWFKCYNGDIGYVKDFEVHIIRNYSNDRYTIQDIYPLGQNVVVSWTNNQFNVFYDILDPEGNKLQTDSTVSDSVIIHQLSANVSIVYGRTLRGFNRGVSVRGELNFNKAIHKDFGANFSVFRFKNSMCVFTENVLLQMDSTSVKEYHFPSTATSGSLVDFNGDVWLASFQGVYKFEEGDFNNYKTYLPNEAVSSIAQDSSGNFWVSTLNNGIYFFKRTKVNTIMKGDFRLISSFENCISAVMDRSQLIRIDMESGMYKTSNSGRDIQHLKCVGHQTYYTYVTGRSSVETNGFELIPLSGHRIIKVDGNRQVLIHKNRIAYFEEGEGTYFKLGNLKSETPFFFEVLSDSSFFISRNDGLYLVSYKFNEAPVIKQLVAEPLRTVTMSDNWNFGTVKGRGLYVYDKDWVLNDTISMADGLSSDYISDIISYKPNGILFLATSEGVDVIKYLPKKQPIVYQRVDVKDGLLKNDIRQLHIHDESLLMASRGGLQKIEINRLFQLSDKPVKVNIFKVNNQLVIDTDSIHLPAGSRDLQVEFTGLSYSEFVSPFIEYRVKELDEKWRKTRSRLAEFGNLNPGVYTFQIKALNSLDKSDMRSVVVVIDAALHETTWFQILVLLAIVGAIIFTWQIRLRNKFKRLNSQMENAKLRQVALATRLNPHFLFNTLGGLQTLVIKKDTDKAVQFINRFSALMRHLLKRSGEDYTVLDDEIQFINAFVEVENIKYGLNVEVEWHIAEGLNSYQLQIPSMFVQPLIENSMKHGFVEYKKEGKISVFVDILDKGMLKIIVEDNGKGTDNPFGAESDRVHSSEIIKNRIELMQNAYHKDYSISFENLSQSSSSLTGTRITLILPYLNA